ncbi:acyltransferase [Ferrimonas futtsuensis]|uniref:acyltransferase n=1 Tax=Ferrimonas futtsuensis TaxID=364764 RepID=UPI00247FBBE2|nr:acyltransferase [Ferrimonas futtsuensis]
MIKVLKKITGFVRGMYWGLSPSVNIKSMKTNIGPFSLLNIESGKLVAKGRLKARSGFILNLISGKIDIGKNVFFNSGVSISCQESISIGDGCIFGENIKVYDHDHVISFGTSYCDTGFKSKPIKIGKNVWIGANVVILKGVSVGDNSVVGAGTLLNKDVPANSICIDKRQKKFISEIKK